MMHDSDRALDCALSLCWKQAMDGLDSENIDAEADEEVDKVWSARMEQARTTYGRHEIGVCVCRISLNLLALFLWLVRR